MSNIESSINREIDSYPLITDFVEEAIVKKLNRDALTNTSRQQTEIGIRHIIDFLELDEETANEIGIEPPSAENLAEITHNEVDDFVTYLTQHRENSEATANKEWLPLIKRIRRIGRIKGNELITESPVQDARELQSYDQMGSATYPNISLEDVADNLKKIKRPDRRAIWVLGLKTGIRVSEMQNLDLPDLHIDYDPYKKAYDDITLRPEIRDKPDTLYIPSHDEIDDTTTYRGEPRKNGNKRSNAVIVPIDGELKHALVRWLSARYPTDALPTPTEPLFPGKGQKVPRLSINTLSLKHVKEPAEEFGWNDYENKNDVAHKWFRHYFTSHHRAPVGGGWGELFNSFFRGDQKPENALGQSQNPYTDLNWTDTFEVYLDHIYKFDLPTLPTAHPY